MRRLAASALFAFMAARAAAQPYGQEYAFGDSLTDNGRIVRLFGAIGIAGLKAQGFDPALGYDDGRFSNGPVAAEYLPGLIGATLRTGNDYAIGGSLSGGGGGLLPNFLAQIGQFAATGQRLAPSDLVILTTGNNDVAVGIDGPQAPVIASVANNIRVGLGELANLGARTIVLTGVADIGLSGLVGSDPATRARATATAAAIDARLRASPVPGANVHYLDIATISERIVADPALYGFRYADPLNPCTTQPACAGQPVSIQDQYFFFDHEHPTTAGHLLVARYAANLLTAPTTVAADADLDGILARDFADAVLRRLAVAPAGEDGPPITVYAQSRAGTGGIASRGAAAGFSYSLGGVNAGLEWRPVPGLTLGGALGYAGAFADLANGLGKLRTDAYGVGLYGGFDAPAVFAHGLVGGSFTDGNRSRAGVLTPLTAAPRAATFLLGAEAGGYLVTTDALRAGPVAQLRYTDAQTHAYTETGDSVLAQSVAAADSGSLLGGVGGRAATRFDLLGVALDPNATLTVERELLDARRTIRTAEAVAPLLPITTEVTNATDGTYGRIAAGLSGTVGSLPGVTADLSVDSTFARRYGDETGIHGTLRASF